MTSCSIIIRTFNESAHLGKLLDGIDKQAFSSPVRLEVIVVDSGSTDSTVAIAEARGVKVVKINKEEFSFGRALNLGIEEASGEFLLFASAHVYPLYNDWIERMLSPFAEKNVGLVYGRQVGNASTKFSEHRVFSKWFPAFSNLKQYDPFCNNANCAIRRSLWFQYKYDEILTGLEDLDWAKKILQAGHILSYNAEAVIVHVHEETYEKIRNRYMREAIALKKIIPSVHVSFVSFIRLFLSNTLSDIFYAIKEGKLFGVFRSILQFRYNQFYGTYLGHLQQGEISQKLRNRFYYPAGIKSNPYRNEEETSKRLIKYSEANEVN